jgi:hypothetical protein
MLPMLLRYVDPILMLEFYVLHCPSLTTSGLAAVSVSDTEMLIIREIAYSTLYKLGCLAS